jgi:hypothetical protein
MLIIKQRFAHLTRRQIATSLHTFTVAGLRLSRQVLLLLIVLLPLILSFIAGLLVAIVAHIIAAVIEGFKAGRSVING